MRQTAPRASVRCLALATGFCLALAPPGRSAEPLPPPRPTNEVVSGPAASAAMMLGAGSCATSSCHGGPSAGNHDVQSFAATLWATRDPHAGAYETLHEPRSLRMAALLGIGAPHRERQCLACHSVQAERESPLPPAVLADGVACGSCHGDATHWIAVHTLPSWKQLEPAERAALGYHDLADVTARVRTCIPCHVGDESREVDHDLVAAGHPRLAFEFAAYQRLWPRHWSPRTAAESQPDFAARSWAVGQAEMLAAVARLLADRAERAAATDAAVASDVEAAPAATRWPEFAEFDCYACHRALSPERVAYGAVGAFRNPTPGVPSWQPWSVAAARLLSGACADPATAAVGDAAADVRDAFGPRWAAADRDQLARVIVSARALETAAAAASQAVSSRRVVVLDASAERLDALVAAEPEAWRFWDAAAQTCLLIEAASPPQPSPAVRELRLGLRFLPGVGGPDGFDPEAFERARRAVSYGLSSGR